MLCASAGSQEHVSAPAENSTWAKTSCAQKSKSIQRTRTAAPLWPLCSLPFPSVCTQHRSSCLSINSPLRSTAFPLPSNFLCLLCHKAFLKQSPVNGNATHTAPQSCLYLLNQPGLFLYGTYSPPGTWGEPTATELLLSV